MKKKLPCFWYPLEETVENYTWNMDQKPVKTLLKQPRTIMDIIKNATTKKPNNFSWRWNENVDKSWQPVMANWLRLDSTLVPTKNLTVWRYKALVLQVSTKTRANCSCFISICFCSGLMKRIWLPIVCVSCVCCLVKFFFLCPRKLPAPNHLLTLHLCLCLNDSLHLTHLWHKCAHWHF